MVDFYEHLTDRDIRRARHRAHLEKALNRTRKLLASPQAAADPELAQKTAPLLLPILSKDGQIPDENLQGLSDAVHLTVDNAADFDVQKIYTYWQDLG